MAKQNGGPAFGGAYDMVVFDTTGVNKPGTIEARTAGMSLRDYFAAMAMAALIAKTPVENDCLDGAACRQVVHVCNGAYGYADAMLKAREQS